MNLFNLVATLVLNKQAYTHGLNSAGKEASSFASKAGVAFKAVGTAVTAVIGTITALAASTVKAINSFTNFTSEIDDNAKALQITSEEYQRLDWLFKQIGADSSTMQMSMRQLVDMTSKLAEGDAEAVLRLQQLGIAYDDFMRMKPYEQFETIVEAFQDMEQGIQKTTLAQEIFGNRAYQKLMPVLNESVGYLDDFNSGLDEMGVIVGKDAVSAGEKLGDNILFLQGTIKSFAMTAIGEFAPTLNKIVTGFIGLFSGADDSIEDLREGFIELLQMFSKRAPEIIKSVGGLAIAIITEVINAFSSQEAVDGLFEALETLLFKIIKFTPYLVQSLLNFVEKSIRSIFNSDFPKLIADMIDAVSVIAFQLLPSFVQDIIGMIIDLFTTAEGLAKLGKIGVAIAQGILNGLITAVESGINSIIKAINKVGSWFGWGGLGEIELPKVKWLAGGGMLDDFKYGTLYGVGENGAEIIAQGKYGTGVTNVEQIKEAQKEAILETAPVIVNGIVSGINMNNTPSVFPDTLILQVDGQKFKAYVVQATNESLGQKGRKTLNSVTRY